MYDERTTGAPWPGSLAIHWEVTWTSQTPDDDGVIDVVPQGVPVPRQVDEVQGSSSTSRRRARERRSERTMSAVVAQAERAERSSTRRVRR